MGRARRARSSGVPRWMLVATVVLGLLAAAGVLLVWQRGRAPRAGGGPLLSDEVAAAIDAARRRAIPGATGETGEVGEAGEVDEAAAPLRALASTRKGRGGMARRERAILLFEAAAIGRLSGAGDGAGRRGREFNGIATAAPPDVVPGQGPQTYGDAGAAGLVLARLPAGLGDVRAPSHALARAHVELLLRQDARAAERVVAWAQGREARGVDLLPGLLAAQARAWTMAAFHAQVLARFVAALPRAAVEERLAAVASERDVDVLTRRACERWLGEVADLPIGLTQMASRDVLLRPTFPDGEIVAAWRTLRDLGAADALRERLRLAAREHAVAALDAGARTALPILHDWIGRHTGMPSRDVPRPAALDAWTAPGVDVVERQVARLGGVRDPQRILLLMEGDMKARAAGHAVLSLIADAALPRPVWPASLPDDVGIVERWRRGLGMPRPAVRLRASHWVLTAGRWSIIEGGRRRGDVRPGKPWRVEFAWSPGALPELALAARVPGTAWGALQAPRYSETIDLSLVGAGNGLTLTAATRQTLRGRGRMVSSGGSGQGWSLPFTVSPTVGVGSQSTPDRFRNHLTLVRPQPPGRASPGLPDGPWDEAAWRRAIAADLTRLADLAETSEPAYEFHNVHQRTLWNLSAICMTLHVPEALPALRRLLAASGNWDFELSRDLLLLAAVHSGAADLVADTRVRLLAKGDGLGGVVEGTIGPGPKSWVRLLMSTDDAATRTLAEYAITRQGLTPDLATDLHDALTAGALRESAAVRAALGTVPPRVAPTFDDALRGNVVALVPVFAADAALLLLLAALLPGSVRRRELPRTAALLVVLGIVASAFSVRLLGIEMLPPWLALPAAAAGALHLAALASSRSGRVAAAAFVVGAVGALTHPALEAAGIFVGVVAVAALGHDLLILAPRSEPRAPRRPSAGASPRLIVLAVLLAGMGAAGVFAALRAAAPPEIAVLLAVALFGGFALGVAAPAIARFDVAVRGRRLPPAFVLVYIVPVGAALVLAALIAGGAMEPLSIGGGAAVLAIALPAVAVSWVLGRLLDAAYALAAARRRGGVARQP